MVESRRFQGVRRAMNHALVESWLSDPNNDDVRGSRAKKKERNHWVGTVRQVGTYRLNLSNKAMIRMSARRVRYEVKAKPIE